MNRATNGARSDEKRAQYPRGARSSVAEVHRLSEERYRPGRRRTTAEPLSASWKPEPQLEQDPEQARKARAERGKARSVFKTYGWRVYVLPILLVITALVVFNTATSPPRQAAGAGAASAGGDAAPAESGPAEKPALPADLNVPTADLPDGGHYTEAGKGTWHVIPPTGDAGKRAGTAGKLYHYTIEVEDGVDPSDYSGDDSFAAAVEATLSSPQSWTGTGKVSLQRVGADYPSPDFRVRLTSPATTKQANLCGFDIKYPTSCYTRSYQRSVVINLARWVRAALAFNGDLGLYRQYAINHEVGHALGNGHVGCQDNGALAPVMMQQTFGVANDYVARLNAVDPYNSKAVPADHKVCRPNAWPVLNLGDTAPHN
ncbi:DUF3152 domain-containing protein [Amycolatopsis rhizosphaerae]|uniref:DUF3152 domain-containing protein n=1 Tax=Amycolatopsis rhizosphaerae TaxID=2053003 RepID=A0A558AK59_9PSEU|nr:DUF3152 domain-containing protein [Amycolatopsis rhizosphaerae]TVT24650.1 DUF3152 domain-containing protein [Amycolatopsis rhizosphaerae]